MIAAPSSTSGVLSNDCEDVISALVNLGYKKPQAEEAVRKVRDSRPSLTIEELIREALSVLMKR
jgi:Holliday junction resolvasome RuvABC DNA-binding subunit